MHKLRLILPLLLFSVTLTLAQNERLPRGQKYPGLIKLQEKPEKDKAKQIFKETFNMKVKDDLQSVSSTTDALGFVHEKFQQYYEGIKVDGAIYRTHVKEGLIWYMSGNFRDIFEDISVTPSISSANAFELARSHVGANRYIWEEGAAEPAGELVIVADPDGNLPPRLAYKFDIYATDPLYRAYVYIDARNGQFIQENSRIRHDNVAAFGTSLYNGTVYFTADNTAGTYRLKQTVYGQGVETYSLNNGTNYSAATDITSTSNKFTSDPTGVQAHWGAEETYKYFFNQHGRNSFNGQGAKILSYVHYSNNYVNAFWDGQRMTYGDGDGINYGPLVSLDIVGHEITHGVTDYAADLYYSYESGALNESFSDIFGEAIERSATGTNDWQMGTDIGINGSGAIRSMNNPNAFNDPDTYLGTYWYSGTGDYGGVHTNSGVQNKWFYILSEGESGVNDLGHAYDVAGIGIEKAAAIAYRNLTVYLSPSSTYADARYGAIQAAMDLFPPQNGEEASPEVIATTNAWYAVGVGGEYGTITYCNSQGNIISYEWIAGVNIGPFSNPSGAGKYSDFTGLTINVDAGQTYNISLVPGFSGQTWSEWWKIWIDYNHNGSFDDPGELAFDLGGLSKATVNGQITIPANANGETRLRVTMKYNGEPTSCGSFAYGEVEDYTISIAGGTPSPLSVNITGSSDITCNGKNDGSATTQAVGGIPPYSYTWNNGSKENSISGLAPGSYTVSVTDSNDPPSTANASVTINEPPVLSATPSGTDVTCGGIDDGTAAANASGGTPPLSYTWTGPGDFASNAASLNELAPGLYQVVVKDANNCQVSGSVTIADPNTTYFADADGDTYGDPGNSVRACIQPQGYITVAGDCDDTDASINPAASEQCDGVDNNCNGNIDEGWPALTFYEDADGDGYGNGASSISACVQPDGYVNIIGDCDDTDALINPAAAEECDGVDNNCDGKADEGCGPTILLAHYFETGWDEWIDGGKDCFRYSGPRSWEGMYSIQLRDGAGVSSSMTSKPYDVRGYGQLNISFHFYAYGMEAGKSFSVLFYNGSAWQTIATFVSGTDFTDNAFGEALISINSTAYTFPVDAQFRFQSNGTHNQDHIYIDAVIVTASEPLAMTLNVPVETSIAMGTSQGTLLQPAPDAPPFTLQVFPIPAQEALNVVISGVAESMRIFSVNGVLLKDILVVAESNRVDISGLSPGLYFLTVKTEQGVQTAKFIKQ